MKRIWSIDAARSIAIFFIVVIHTSPFNGMGAVGNAIDFVLNSFARFAVPLFFMMSGYLFVKRRRESDGNRYVGRYLRKLAGLYLFGVVVSLPVKAVFYAGQAVKNGDPVLAAVGSELLVAFDPVDFLYYGKGIAGGLWFLAALFYSVLFIHVLRRKGWGKYALPLGFALHVVGMFGQSLRVVATLPVDTIDAVFVGFFFTAVGVAFADGDFSVDADRSGLYLGVFVVASLARLVEMYVIGYVLGGAAASELAGGVYVNGYSPVTVVVAVSAFMFVLSRPELGRDTVLPRLGKYAVGVYLLHPPLLVLVRDVGARGLATFVGVNVTGTVLWQLLLTPTLFATSLLLYRALETAGVLERFYGTTDAGLLRVQRTTRLAAESARGRWNRIVRASTRVLATTRS